MKLRNLQGKRILFKQDRVAVADDPAI